MRRVLGLVPILIVALFFGLGVFVLTGGTYIITPSDDAYLKSTLTTAPTTGNTLKVGFDGANKTRTIARYNLSTVPSNEPIIAVHVKAIVTKASAAGDTRGIAMYRCLRDVNITQMGWNEYSDGNNWAAAGADSGWINWIGAGKTYADSAGSSSTYDRALDPSGFLYLDGLTPANGDTLFGYLDPAQVARWVDGTNDTLGLIFQMFDETTVGTVNLESLDNNGVGIWLEVVTGSAASASSMHLGSGSGVRP